MASPTTSVERLDSELNKRSYFHEELYRMQHPPITQVNSPVSSPKLYLPPAPENHQSFITGIRLDKKERQKKLLDL